MNKDKIIEQRIKDKQKRIDKAIDRRDKSIAYFNSINAAINLYGNFDQLAKTNLTKKNIQEVIIEWRDWFYQEWLDWYEKENTIQPITTKTAFEITEKFQKDMEESEKQIAQAKLDEINREAQEEAEYTGEQQSERSFEEHNKSK